MTEAYLAFGQIDIRVGVVQRVEPNTEAIRPAYKMWIDFGDLGVKTTSAQYTQLYRPDDLVGRQVVCAVNLGTRRIAGFASEVLMLGAPNGNGAVVFLTTEQQVPLGAKVF